MFVFWEYLPKQTGYYKNLQKSIDYSQKFIYQYIFCNINTEETPSTIYIDVYKDKIIPLSTLFDNVNL